jgi:ubiquitin carboxyl-terminal hydrolase 8
VCPNSYSHTKSYRNCPNCKRPQRATKQLRIARLPTILIIVLKRFHYEGPWRDKLNTFVDFPMRNLDLTKYALPSSSKSRSPQPEKSENYLYDLYAVTNHFGTLSGGHCTSFSSLLTSDTACIHNNLRGKWFVFDDSRVSPCEDSSVVVR